MTSDDNSITKKLYFRGFNAVDQLETFLAEISNPSMDSMMHGCQCYELEALGVDITLPILNLFIQVLTHPLPKAPNSPNDLRWDGIKLTRCKFVGPRLTRQHPEVDEGGLCSQDSLEIFAAALACRTVHLHIIESREILESLLKAHQFEFQTLSLNENEFSSVTCAGLGSLVQKCVSLKDLVIRTNHLEEPLLLGEGLKNAVHLQSVSIAIKKRMRHNQNTFEYVVGNRWEGFVGQLLDPQCRLKELILDGMYVEDHHFSTIVEMLPPSQVQVLNLHNNCIGHQGILAFARQLPKSSA
jgi:hypothetical protein